MKRPGKGFFLSALMSLALALPCQAFAGIDVEDGYGDIMQSLLQSDADMFADAIQARLKAGSYPYVRGARLRSLRAATRGATIARFEYRYAKNGVEAVRVYHARSGHSIDRMLGKFNREGTSSSESAETTPVAEDADIRTDFSERIYYPADTASNIRVAKLPPKPDSKIDAVHTGEVTSSGEPRIIHGVDAELKILRRIEYDIEDGIVPRGGEITGHVSQAVCPSCSQALDAFTQKFDVHGKVYQLNTAKAIGGPAPSAERLASNRSSQALAESRKAAVGRQIDPDGASPSIRSWSEDASYMARLEAEEAVEGTASAAGCDP
ncbi:hypothetical protein SAMN02800694_3397 [Luteibacter sp. UNCMF331Sha3.1]|uniref:hypothetical protein n=1 Tax=Luteibacter sp. UNCMF331Sha3.1 TaxID=1502760 RepID=UPI0008D4D0FE|nr:hypothetical protein [Luteibacter sp. UNCMF331Sha3.1]SEN40873.1 hypothetical protein SAMN02800694_3397 [Luteibacter sp. UNCMF331Sha3.1]